MLPMLTRTLNRPNDRLAILTFRLGSSTYALLIEDVVEVEAMVELMPVLDGPPEVLGLVNRHGSILPLVDLRILFKQPASQVSSLSFFIVAVHESWHIGLVVDEVHQVEYVNFIQMEETLASGKYIRGMINLRSQLIPVIALAPLVEAFLAHQQAG